METSFYLDLDHSDPSNNSEFNSLLDQYFTKYVCGKEISQSNVKHYQVWCYHDSDKNAYANFIQRAKKRWSLQGRATKNTRKEYGKIRGVIRDTDNMISYCVKDHDYTFKGFEEDYIRDREISSFQKEDSEIQKYRNFLQLCGKLTKLPSTFAPGPHECYSHRLNNAKIICTQWYCVYQRVIPKTMIDKALFDLGLQSHEDIARERFRSYLGETNFF